MNTTLKRICLGALALALVPMATACSGGSTDETEAQDTTSVILDWSPNTNHTGLFVALEKGYYDEVGINVDVKGYSQAGAETVLSNGGVDFAFSYAPGLENAVAAGNKIKMVFNLQQKDSLAMAVAADSDYQRPRDLEGKVFASGSGEVTGTEMQQMIRNDGGSGEFETVFMGTGAYDAVANGEADFANALSTWEGIEFEMQGKPLRFFYPDDYGVPSSPASMGLSTSQELIDSNPDLVQRFISATKKGYDYALEHPEEAAEILVSQNPEAKLDPELVRRSQVMLSEGFWKDSRGETGLANLEHWDAYSKFLVDNGLITDQDGNKLTEPIPTEDLVTNEFVQ